MFLKGEMDLLSLLRVLLRRWLIALPCLVIAGAFAAQTLSSRDVSYLANGSVLLSPPAVVTAEQPVLGVENAKGVIVELLQRPSVRAALGAQGLSTDYSAMVDVQTSLISITVIAPDPESAIATSQALVETASARLAEAVGDQIDLFQVDEIDPPTEADVVAVEGAFQVRTALALLESGLAGTNPYPASLATVRALLEVSRGVEFISTVLEAAPSASVIVDSELRDAAPIIAIETAAENPDDALAAFGATEDALRERLVSLQTSAGVPPDLQTQLTELASPPGAFETSASQLRPIAAIVLLGFVAAIGLSLLVESLVQGRRERRSEP